MEDHQAERAFTIGRKIATLGNRAEKEGLDVGIEMNGLLKALACATSESVEDAHALSLISWLLLTEALRRLPRGTGDEVFAFNIVHFATIFGERAVQTLEGITGIPSDAFSGEDRFRQ